MQSFNMVNQTGCFAIGDGGRVKLLNDRGKTAVIPYQERPEANWRKKAREMVANAKAYYPSPRESALERELWNQVSGGNRAAANVSPKLAADYAAYQSRLNRESSLEQQLMNQISSVR